MSMRSLEAPRVGAVRDRGVELVERVDAAGVAQADPLLAGALGEGLEDVALARAGLAGDDDAARQRYDLVHQLRT
jgi:hypothetical protein